MRGISSAYDRPPAPLRGAGSPQPRTEEPSAARCRASGKLGDKAGADRRPTGGELGSGTHAPGHATALRQNLATALGLEIRAPRAKRIVIAHPRFQDQDLGEINVSRLTDTGRRRDLLFYELTWSPITQPDKDLLAFDKEQEYVLRRAAVNQAMRSFVNDISPDPLAYAGRKHEPILTAVGQSVCWMGSRSWSELPELTEGTSCGPTLPGFGSRLDQDDWVIVTHSLGSRATLDALQGMADLPIRTDPALASFAARFTRTDNHPMNQAFIARYDPTYTQVVIAVDFLEGRYRCYRGWFDTEFAQVAVDLAAVASCPQVQSWPSTWPSSSPWGASVPVRRARSPATSSVSASSTVATPWMVSRSPRGARTPTQATSCSRMSRMRPRPMPLMPVSERTLGHGRPEINCTARSSLMWAMAVKRSAGSALMSTQSARADAGAMATIATNMSKNHHNIDRNRHVRIHRWSGSWCNEKCHGRRLGR